MDRIFTRCFWVTLIDGLRAKAGKPRSMRKSDDRLLTDCIKIIPSDGVTIRSMEVIAVGRKVCSEHHWHKVKTSGRHGAMVAKASGMHKLIHEDFVCCKCTFGKCSINGE